MGNRILHITRPANPIFYPNYGLEYNWFAATDVRNITSEGWHISSMSEIQVLRDYYGGSTVAGGKLKEIGTTYWNTPNTGADNESKFNGRGTGLRTTTGLFGAEKVTSNIWTSTEYPVAPYNEAYNYRLTYYTAAFGGYNNTKTGGLCLRPLKDSTTLMHGQTGTYTGNDGKVYRTICIGTQEWLADYLAETRFRNGDIVPWYGANIVDYFTTAEWASLTTAGCCALNNDLSKVAAGFSFPT